ncbi:MAG: hypothetical protein K0R66_1477 [Gammaproteobacteria bacterium]|jgi:hypothetical protein|nr:hypothetical protein [Gammaproteobacteria bacterium]
MPGKTHNKGQKMFSFKKLATAIATGIAALTGTAQAQEYYSDIMLLPAGATYTFPQINSTSTTYSCMFAYQQFRQANATTIFQVSPDYRVIPTPSGAYIPFEIIPYEVDPKFGSNLDCRLPLQFSGLVYTNPSSVDIVLSIAPLLENAAEPKVSYEQLHEAPLHNQIFIMTPVVALAKGDTYKLQTNIKEGNVTCITQTVDSAAAVAFNTNVQPQSMLEPLRETIHATTSGTDYIDITSVNAHVHKANQNTSILVTNKGPATAFLSCFKDVPQESPSATV